VELYNPNTNSVDVAGQSLTDDLANPRQFVFPTGSMIPAKGWLRILCDPDRPPSGTNTGFGLRSAGESLYLLDAPARGGVVTDSIAFGLQVADRSISRVPDGSGTWVLGSATPNAANQPATLGDPSNIRINEWMANPAAGDDWFELQNPGADPVDLSGFHLTDDLNVRDRHTLPALSFIGTGTHGYILFHADGNPGQGADHVNFSLSKAGESIGLFWPNQYQIDGVTFGPQEPGVSEGRLPDGSATIVAFPKLPTPGSRNLADADADGIDDDWESTHGLSSSDPTDSELDPDKDGASNRLEFLTGTNPSLGSSVLALKMEFSENAGPTLSFTAEVDRAYRVEFSDGVVNGTWKALAEISAHPVQRGVSVSDLEPPTDLTRYYRVAVVSSP